MSSGPLKFCLNNSLFFAILSLAVCFGCSDDEVGDPSDVDVDVGEPDVSEGEDVADVSSMDADTDGDADADAGEPTTGLQPVELDFDEHLPAPESGFVRAAQVESEDDLIDGEVAQGMMGDWILENDHGRFLVGLGERAIGPCSWDGNVIEAESLDDGEGQESVLGEICLLLNVGQTMRPDSIELIEDGSDGRAVVAVTGEVVPLDFLNIRNMITEIAPGLYDLIDIDPDRSFPVTITVYYALTPESHSLRVLTAFRNDGDEVEYFNVSHLILSGSTGSFFNPMSSRQGWGYEAIGMDNMEADPVSFIGYFSRHAGYAVVPDPDEEIDEALPSGGAMVAIAGVVGMMHGTTDLMGTLLANEQFLPNTEGYIGLEPGDIDTVGYRLYPADGSVSSASDLIYDDLGVETSTLRGRVVDHDGSAQAGVKVTPLLAGERAYTMSWTDADGEFAMNVPHGDWELRARDEGRLTQITDIEADGSDVELGDVELEEPAEVEVRIRTPDGEPTPARIVVDCASDCDELHQDSRERDPDFLPPRGWLKLVEVGVDGDAVLRLAAGDYEISVNRGMTWTTWPQDAGSAGGEVISVEAGEQRELDVEIAQVVDTTGLLSADFHIHAMASPDSSTPARARVLDFLAGGLDVMVSSDHDAVYDFQPDIDALGAGDHITSVVGNEITASNLGHINAFPLEREENSRRGGALDWSRQGGDHLTLQEVVDATREHPGEQVIQLNHPRMPLGAIGLMQADVLTGQSFADPELLRMPDDNVDEDTGDTGLWTDDFDAIEVYNGFSMSSFWSTFRWWLTMVGRGFSPTATAVSDTHGIYGSLGASPRSFVTVDEEFDTPATMNLEHFVERVRSGALVGTNGPLMRVEISNDNGDTAVLGEVLDASAGEATAEVTLEMPEWVEVDTLDVYMNVPADEIHGEPGEEISSAVEPTERISIDWTEEHRELVAEGDFEHHRLRQIVEVPFAVDVDSYVVFVARGLSGSNMRPVVSSGARPLAFSNPVYLDADGGGFDNPPLAELMMQRMEQPAEERFQGERARRVIIDHGDEVTPEALGRVIDALSCDHGLELDDEHSHEHEHGHSHDHGHHH